MTWVQVLGTLLIVVGLLYAVLYARWLRRRSSSQSPAGLVSDAPGLVTDTATEPAAGQSDGHSAGHSDGHSAKPILPLLPEGSLNLAWVEGTYLTTTVAVSRQERVVAAGMGTRCRATMVVDENVVRWERRGTNEVRVAGPQVVEVSLGRSRARWLRRRARLVLVSWTGDRVHNEDPHMGGDRYLTGFQPRSKADSAVLVSAIQRLMQIRGPHDSAPTTPDGNP